jgi:hypothetical protein
MTTFPPNVAKIGRAIITQILDPVTFTPVLTNDGTGMQIDASLGTGIVKGGALVSCNQVQLMSNWGAGTMQLWSGAGTPNNTLGVNGDIWFRNDTPATSLQRIYIKSAGAWVGIV